MRAGVPLAPLTTLRIGGPARWLLDAPDEQTLIDGVAWARREGLPLTLLGGGSNMVVADEGVPGLVLRPALRDFELDSAGPWEPGAQVRLRLGAGLVFDEVVARTVALGLAGLECLSGIPGWVGALPIQNVGAYGQEIADCLVAVEALELATKQVQRIPAQDCDFGYRDSRFKSVDRGRFAVLRVELALVAHGPPTLAYAQLRDAVGAEPDLATVRRTVLALRRSKGMVLDAHDRDTWSAGSFFTNPILDPAAFAALEQRVAERLPAQRLPRWPQTDGRTKTSAAWLIERAGFHKGYRRGEVGLSTRHTLALTNRAGATAASLWAFAAHIADGVEAAFGVRLEPEPQAVPEGSGGLGRSGLGSSGLG